MTPCEIEAIDALDSIAFHTNPDAEDGSYRYDSREDALDFAYDFAKKTAAKLRTAAPVLDGAEQVDMEEAIAREIVEEGDQVAGRFGETASTLGRSILRIVLTRFRPDLFEDDGTYRSEGEPGSCILTGGPGENPDDCSTHKHEPHD